MRTWVQDIVSWQLFLSPLLRRRSGINCGPTVENDSLFTRGRRCFNSQRHAERNGVLGSAGCAREITKETREKKRYNWVDLPIAKKRKIRRKENNYVFHLDSRKKFDIPILFWNNKEWKRYFEKFCVTISERKKPTLTTGNRSLFPIRSFCITLDWTWRKRKRERSAKMIL